MRVEKLQRRACSFVNQTDLCLDSFRKAGHEAIDAICDYYQTLSTRPVMAQVEPGFLSKVIPGKHADLVRREIPSSHTHSHPLDEAPEHGEEWSQISKDYQDIILPGMTHW